MPSFTPSAVEPGVFFRISDVQVPNVPAGAFIPVLIGLGSKTLQAVQQITKGAANGADGPLSNLPVIRVLSVIGFDGVTYLSGTDYTFSTTGGNANKIDWAAAGAEPATGSTYFVTYEYEKAVTDYAAKLYSRVQDAITTYGPASIQTVLDTGTATAGGSNTLTDSSKTFTVNAFVGNYVKITGGTGAGQIRVIVSNTATVLTVSSNWGTNPDGTSVYQITDIAEDSISLAAQILFENTAGNGFLYVVQAKEDTTTEFTAALDRIKDVDNAYALVVLKGMTTGNALLATIKTHVDSQSSTLGRHERIALIGAPVNQVLFTTFSSVATGLNDPRVVYVSPGEVKREIDGVIRSLDGSYLAAAIAGIITNPVFDAGEPISGKPIAGFSDVVDPFLRSEKNSMAANGVLIIEKQGGIPTVRHALSTAPANIIDAEVKVTRIKDDIINTLRINLQRAFINTRNVGPETLSAVKAFIKLLLDSKTTQRVINSFESLDVSTNISDPRQIDVSFKIKPTFDINYIFVTFGVTL